MLLIVCRSIVVKTLSMTTWSLNPRGKARVKPLRRICAVSGMKGASHRRNSQTRLDCTGPMWVPSNAANETSPSTTWSVCRMPSR